MSPDFATQTLGFSVAAFFALAVSAAALTVDLEKVRDSQPVSLDISRTDTNRIELPETIINAFSSNESMDVKIIGRSALVRTQDPAELIILTEKRRLTLLLAPEDGPSRTVIMKAGKQGYCDAGGKESEHKEALPYEKIITDLVIYLASGNAPARKIRGKEQKLAGSLSLTHRGEAAAPPFLATLYVVRNDGESVALRESMFSAGPETVAVGIERETLLRGESSRVFVVTKKEIP